MSMRALELLDLDPSPKFLLDLGCGSGLSGQVLSDNGHVWVGLDISNDMLEIASQNRTGDLFLQDLGAGLGFRPGTFDGAFSISALQWLCNADQTNHDPRKRLYRFFSTLYTALVRGARAVFQFYPENENQTEMILAQAVKAGFSGGLVVDYPNSAKAKKYYLCLFAGSDGSKMELPEALDDEYSVPFEKSRIKSKSKRTVKDKQWVLHKKELYRSRGKDTPLDSKFTARKRRPKF
jgi:18S rRNA (guanine1575-N7)-methyltransferase